MRIIFLAPKREGVRDRWEFISAELTKSGHNVTEIAIYKTGNRKSFLSFFLFFPKALAIHGDMIIGFSPYGAFLAWLISFIRRRPFIVSLDDFNLIFCSTRFKMWLFYFWEKNGSERAQYVVVPTPQIKEALEETYNLNPERVIVIPHGADEMLSPSKSTGPTPFPLRKENLVVGYIGAMTQAKGIDIILETINILKDQKVQFAVVGGGPLLNDLQKLSDELGPAKLWAPGAITDRKIIASVYKSINILVAPYVETNYGKYSDAPLKVSEAMAAGVPVILPRMENFEQYLGNIPIFFFPRDAVSLSAVLLDIIEHKINLKEHSQRGLQHMAGRTWDEVSNKYTFLMSKALKQQY